MDALGSWDPTNYVKASLDGIIKLLGQPNLEFVRNAEAAKMFKEDPAGFAQKAQEWAVKPAGAPAIKVDQSRYVPLFPQTR
jgi:ubiquitin-conjugating enzyme (huntingtin interacting protein 2)